MVCMYHQNINTNKIHDFGIATTVIIIILKRIHNKNLPYRLMLAGDLGSNPRTRQEILLFKIIICII